MGRPLTYQQREQRRKENQAEQERKWAAQDKRDENKRVKEESRQEEKLSSSKSRVDSYDLFRDILLSFHKKNIIEKPSLVNLKAILNLPKLPEAPTNTTFQDNVYVADKSLISRKNRLKKWSKNSYEDWCKKEGISSSLLASLLSSSESKFAAFLAEKKNQIIDIDAELKKQKDKHNQGQNIKKLEVEEFNLSASIEYEKALKNYYKLKALKSLRIIDKKNKVSVWEKRLSDGDISAMNDVSEMIFPINFKDDEWLEKEKYIRKGQLPSQATVGYKIVDAEKIEVVIYLSKDLDFLPKYKPSLQNNKLLEVQVKPEEEVQAKQHIICGTAITYLHRIFSTMKSVNNIKLEVNVKAPNPATGHEKDFVLLYININRNDFEQCDLQRIDPTRFILDQENSDRVEKEFNHRPMANPMINERIEKRNIRLVDKKNQALSAQTIGKDIFSYFVHSVDMLMVFPY